MRYSCVIEKIYTSEAHNYFTREKYDIGTALDVEHETILLSAGEGLPNDRFMNATYPVTFFSKEVADEIFEYHQCDANMALFRRNIIVSGINVQELIGETFRVGEVTFEGIKHCNPCPWMNAVFGANTYAKMKGRGGLRACVSKGGSLSLGRTNIVCSKTLIKEPCEPLIIKKIP